MTTEQEYVVYNTITDSVVTPPMPRENAESICAEFWDAGSRRYAIRPVVGFDYDAAIDDLTVSAIDDWLDARYEGEHAAKYERQWATALHPWAWRGVAGWFVVFHAVGLAALWAR